MAYVLRFLLSHRDQHDQRTWGRIGDLSELLTIGGAERTEYGGVEVPTGEAVVPEIIDCGTAACFAGWTVILTPGYRLMVDIDGHAFEAREVATGRWRSVEGLAQQLLGLSSEEAHAIFYEESTLADIVDRLSDMTGVDFEREAVL